MKNIPQKHATPRTDTVPTDGYVLSVDGKLKAKFETSEEAMAAGLKLQTSLFNSSSPSVRCGSPKLHSGAVTGSGTVTRKVATQCPLLALSGHFYRSVEGADIHYWQSR